MWGQTEKEREREKCSVHDGSSSSSHSIHYTSNSLSQLRGPDKPSLALAVITVTVPDCSETSLLNENLHLFMTHFKCHIKNQTCEVGPHISINSKDKHFRLETDHIGNTRLVSLHLRKVHKYNGII